MKQTKDRNTLKGYFKKGSIPTEEQFATLIDSVPNLAEDGQAVRTAEGWSLYPEAGKPLQISLHEAENAPAAWTLCLTPEKGLAVRNAQGETVAELGQDKSVTLYGECVGPGPAPEPTPEPAPGYVEIKTDRQWADLVQIPHGEGSSRVYTVFALLRDPDFGSAELTRATAICLGGSGWSVESRHRHWWGWSGGVKLRWRDKDGKACLQIRSRRSTFTGRIHCRVTESFRERTAEENDRTTDKKGE